MDDKDFEQYFKKYITEQLSNEEEMDCTVTIYTSDDLQEKEKCIRKLIKATLQTVFNLAKRYQGKGAPLEKLVSEGYHGLFAAIKRFDPFYEPKTRFATFAYFYIKDSILNVFRKNKKDFGFSVPIPLWELVRDSDLPKYADQKVISLDALSTIPDFERKFGIPSPKTPEEEAIEKTDEEYLVSHMRKILEPREFEVALHLIGFKYLDYKHLKPKELAKKLDLTVTRIWQLTKKIGEKLVDNGLVDFQKKKGKVLWK